MSISKRYMLDFRARRVALEGHLAPGCSNRCRALAQLVMYVGTGPFTIEQVREVWDAKANLLRSSATTSSRITAFIKNGYFQEVQ